MPHLHSDLLAVTRRVTDIVGSDRVIDSHEQTEKGRIDILVESLQAVAEFTQEFDGRATEHTNFLGRKVGTSVAMVDGITVTVSGHDYVSAVSA